MTLPADPSQIRPAFVSDAPLPTASASGGLQFFGDTHIQGPVAGRDVIINNPATGADSRAYLDAVADVYSYWRNQYILGPASAAASPFIPTDAAALVRRLLAGPGGGIALRARPITLPDAITFYRRILLLGKPGAGKSSYLQYLALLCTRPDPPVPLLPVLVELHDYTAATPFLTFLQDTLRWPPNPAPPEPPIHVTSPWLADALPAQLEAGQVLLLLDGLNELPSTDRAARLAAVSTFLATYPRVRVVVTCRVLDYRDDLAGGGVQTVLLDPWTPAQMAAYLTQRGAHELLPRLQAGDSLLLRLGEVPFLLFMLTELLANRPPGPSDPLLISHSALFSQFIDLLLSWAELKDPANARWFPRPIVQDALSRLAAAVAAAGYRGTPVPRAWAIGQVLLDPANVLQVPPLPDFAATFRARLLDYGCAATILDSPADRATVGFWHLTHQDYFAALAPAVAGRGPFLPLAPENDETNSLAAASAPNPTEAIHDLLVQPTGRAPLVAAKAFLAISEE